MDRDFLRLKINGKKLYLLILASGLALTVSGGVLSWTQSRPEKGILLPRNPAGKGSYEQKITAEIEGFEKIPVSVTVEERRLTQKEAEAELKKAEEMLPEMMKGENESLQKITKELNLVEKVPGTIVEVSWQTDAPEYFSADMTLREDRDLKEPVTIGISAVLSCQKHTKDFSAEITLFPREQTAESILYGQLKNSDAGSSEKEFLYLPQKYEGKDISWRKPPDMTFLYFPILALAAVVLLKLGEKRDEEQKARERKESFERSYAALVSRFSMLLSAGLSVRNAWERIVRMSAEYPDRDRVLFLELRRALYEMQQGVAELEVYERVGERIGLVHYKKLMAIFISDRRRGSVPLREAMEGEMLEAWDEKKRLTKQQGEKIGTKLLVPMMGMLSVVFMMIIIPAFLSFRI